jgi:hypothetical protein
MPENVIYAEEGSVIVSGLGTHGAGAAGEINFSAEVKEISVTGGGRDVEAVRCFGNASYFDEKPQEPFECSLTMIKKDADMAGLILEGSDTSDPRLWSGDSTPRGQARQITFLWGDATSATGPGIRVTMSSAFAVSKELSLNSTDHLEETINFKCLPKNYKEEASANKSTLP